MIESFVLYPLVISYTEPMSVGKKRSYAKSYQRHNGGVRSLQWANYRAAAIRLRELVQNIPLEGKRILDIGCGFGDLIPFIAAQTLNFTYTGVDLLHEFTEEAQKRYPECKFVTADYFSKPFGTFDVIFCSGALNGRGDAIEERKRKIQKMFNNAKEVLIFNMAGGTNIQNSENSKLFYADSTDILSFCISLTPKIIFKQHYHFTITMFK